LPNYLGPLLELEDEDGVLRRGHAALEEEHEDEEVVRGRHQPGAPPRRHERHGEGGHDEEALQHDDARPAEQARVEALEALREGAGEDEEDAGDVGGAHGAEGVEERGERRAVPEEEPVDVHAYIHTYSGCGGGWLVGWLVGAR